MNSNLQKYIDDSLKKINIINKNKHVFFTALFKNNKEVDTPQLFKKENNYDYILFTNVKDLNTSWTIIYVNLFYVNLFSNIKN